MKPDRTNPVQIPWVRLLAWMMVGMVALGIAALTAILTQTGLGAVVGRVVSQALALDSVQVTWYVTRAAGWTAYLLLWLSTAWGLAVSSKIFDSLLQRTFTYDFHQFLSLLALGFVAVHIVVLVFDQYLPFSVAQILVPFLSSYRPLWVGIGGMALYLSVLVTVTFYLRRRIGMKAFRLIHVLSLVGYFGAALHGLLAGTDSPLPAAQLLYLGTFLSVVFLMSHWLITGLLQKVGRETSPRQLTDHR